MARSGCWIMFIALLGSLLGPIPVARAAEVSSPSRGMVLVFPPDGQPMPDLSNTVKLLQDGGFRAPGVETELTDGRRVLQELGEGWLFLGAELAGRCGLEAPAVPGESASMPVPPPTPAVPHTMLGLSSLVKDAERQIFLTDYAGAGKRLAEAKALLPCLAEPLAREELYRLHFLSGLAAFFQEKRELALKGFELALAVDPSRDWDQRFPPSAWELFLKAKGNVSARTPVTFRAAVGVSPAQVFLDGQPVGVAGVGLTAGEHLVQLAAGEGVTRLEGFLISAGREPGGEGAWLTSAAVLKAGLAGTQTGQKGPEVDAFVAAVARRARARGASWALVAASRDGGQGPVVSYVDVARCSLADPPAELRAGPEDITIRVPGRGQRKVQVPGVLAGWHVIAGVGRFQQLGATDGSKPLQLSGLEVGGLRRVAGSYHARTALGLGAGTFDGETSLFLTFLVGARRTWELEPFGLYAEGGIMAFRFASSPFRVGASLRGGTYYTFGVGARNGIELFLGVDGILSPGAFFGQGGLAYQRAF